MLHVDVKIDVLGVSIVAVVIGDVIHYQNSL